MCGIGGIYSRTPLTNAMDMANRFLDGLSHRGPDGSGVFVGREQTTLLVHTRLAILDLSASGRQPMGTLDGRYQIVFNGEIYNYRDLQAELRRGGERFIGSSDTEVVLKLFARDGVGMLRRLQGMFAFAIWDEMEQSLFLARDPLGIKPLYYWNTGEAFGFSSEFRTLLSLDLAPRKLDLDGVGKYLCWGSVQEPGTLVQGIKQLPAGSFAMKKSGQLEIQNYWRLKFEDRVTNIAEAVSNVRAGLEESVTRHLVSDVPVGAFLSGGIDSTAVVALASERIGSDLRTFCISFEESEFDEGKHAARTAKHFKTSHMDWCITSDVGRQLLYEFMEHSDLPSNDGLNTYCVSKFAKSNGLKVVMSGLGGDELFGGYPSFSVVPKLQRVRRRLGAFGMIAGATFERMSSCLNFEFRNRLKSRRLATFMASEGRPSDAYWAIRGFLSPSEAVLTIQDLVGESALDGAGWLGVDIVAGADDRNSVGALEIEFYMRNQLLKDSDVMSMANGLELRVPLVDRTFLEHVLMISPEIRYRANKQLLLDAVPEIPSWVWGRKKQGFQFPFKQWVRDDWSKDFDQLEKLTRVRLVSWYRKFIVFTLMRFMEKHSLY